MVCLIKSNFIWCISYQEATQCASQWGENQHHLPVWVHQGCSMHHWNLEHEAVEWQTTGVYVLIAFQTVKASLCTVYIKKGTTKTLPWQYSTSFYRRELPTACAQCDIVRLMIWMVRCPLTQSRRQPNENMSLAGDGGAEPWRSSGATRLTEPATIPLLTALCSWNRHKHINLYIMETSCGKTEPKCWGTAMDLENQPKLTRLYYVVL